MLKSIIKKQAFDPGWLGIVTNSSYITRSRLIRSIRRLSDAIGGRVLDLGCGAKPYEALFTRATDYIGVDMMQSGHSHAESRIDVFYDGKTLPFEDATFDSVVSFEVFEHIFNLPDILAELRRVVRPGGMLLATVPFAWPEHEQPYDFARYTSFGLQSTLERAGFEVRTIEKTSSFLLAVAQLLIAMVHLILERAPAPVRLLGRMFVIFPMNAVSLLLDRVVPKREEFFCNLVVIAQAR